MIAAGATRLGASASVAIVSGKTAGGAPASRHVCGSCASPARPKPQPSASTGRWSSIISARSCDAIRNSSGGVRARCRAGCHGPEATRARPAAPQHVEHAVLELPSGHGLQDQFRRPALDRAPIDAWELGGPDDAHADPRRTESAARAHAPQPQSVVGPHAEFVHQDRAVGELRPRRQRERGRPAFERFQPLPPVGPLARDAHDRAVLRQRHEGVEPSGAAGRTLFLPSFPIAGRKPPAIPRDLRSPDLAALPACACAALGSAPRGAAQKGVPGPIRPQPAPR